MFRQLTFVDHYTVLLLLRYHLKSLIVGILVPIVTIFQSHGKSPNPAVH